MEHGVLQRKITFQDRNEGILKAEDGTLFKLVDKEKKINTRPIIVFVYDIATLIMAILSVVLWDSINKNLFDNSPFQNYVVQNAIIFACKFIVVVFGVIGIIYANKGRPNVFQIYSAIRLTETFLIGSVKFVYTIGLFNYSYQNNIDETQSPNFKSFVTTMAVFNLFDTLVYIGLNVYFCNQVWIGLQKRLVLENFKNDEMIELPTSDLHMI